MSNPGSPSPATASSTGTWVVGIVCGLLLYLLSPGLFVLSHKAGITLPPWVETSLAPIAWACRELPVVEHLYAHYFRFLGTPV